MGTRDKVASILRDMSSEDGVNELIFQVIDWELEHLDMDKPRYKKPLERLVSAVIRDVEEQQ